LNKNFVKKKNLLKLINFFYLTTLKFSLGTIFSIFLLGYGKFILSTNTTKSNDMIKMNATVINTFTKLPNRPTLVFL